MAPTAGILGPDLVCTKSLALQVIYPIAPESLTFKSQSPSPSLPPMSYCAVALTIKSAPSSIPQMFFCFCCSVPPLHGHVDSLHKIVIRRTYKVEIG